MNPVRGRAAGPDAVPPQDSSPATGEGSALDAPARLAALQLTGATARADETFDAFAQMVRRLLDVPVALVSLVDDHRQCLVGATGLPAVINDVRQTPLSHSFCQYVVRTRRPLVVADALADPLLRGNGAVSDLGVVAYAGMPLTDAAGEVLGSLAAIDSRPRDWTPPELETLRELASACSTELRLRAETRRLLLERDTSEHLRRELADRNAHLTVTARLATTVARTLDFTTVAQTVCDHLAEAFKGWAAVAASAGDEPSTVVESHATGCSPELLETVAALRTVLSADSVSVLEVTGHPLLTAVPGALGAERVVALPIAGRITQGLVIVGLPPGAAPPDAVASLIKDISVTAALALDNATLLARHRRTAETLQRQMLSDVPHLPGAVLAASYQAATDDAAIGGDWYDAFVHPDGSYWLVIGDVMGHDLHAAGTMARLQHFVRAVALDGHRSPNEVLERIEPASRASCARRLRDLRRCAAPPGVGPSTRETVGGGVVQRRPPTSDGGA